MLEQYRKLNEGYKKKLVFRLDSGSGFYSELNNMLLSMLYCLDNKIQFQLYSRKGILSLSNGWSDYFEPFCVEITDDFHAKYNFRNLNKKNNRPWHKWIRFFGKRLKGFDFYTFDFFQKARSEAFISKQFYIPELGIDGDLRAALKVLVGIVYRFNALVQAEVNGIIGTLKLPKKYAGLHVRGGDKGIEDALLSPDRYMEKLKSVSDLKDVFVLTDDYGLFEHLQKNYSEYSFVTTCKEEERGYFIEKVVSQTQEDVYKQHIRLLAAVEMLGKAEASVGTYSTNPGMFLGVVSSEFYGIDRDKWVVW